MKTLSIKKLPTNQELIIKTWRTIAPCQKPFKNKKKYDRKRKENLE